MKERRDIEELYERAKKTARLKGHSEIAEDFAGWCVERWLSGKSQHQTINYSLIDFLRLEYGSLGSRCGADGLLRARRQRETEISGHNESSDEEALERMFAGSSHTQGDDPGSSYVERFDFDPRDYLPSRIREIYKLICDDEITLNAVGHRFGISESRVSQVLSVAKKIIARFHGLNEMRERIEDGRTEIEIEWISL